MTTSSNFASASPKISKSKDSPAFFTGCVECIQIAAQVPTVCDFSLPENAGFSDATNSSSFKHETFSSQTANVCENKRETILENHTSNVRRTLLPSPDMSSKNFIVNMEQPLGTSRNFHQGSPSLIQLKPTAFSNNRKRTIISNDHQDGPKRKGNHLFSFEGNTKRIRPSAPTSCDSATDKLSRSIWKLYSENKQTLDVYQKKMRLRSELHELLQQVYPNCALYVVGSSLSGLGANSSDMDMCLMLTQREIDQNIEATSILHVIYDLFLQQDFLQELEVIPAKVPILKFTDYTSGIEVDLNVNNAVGIRNTQLLNSYSRMDERFPPLVLVTKLWARHHDINDAKNFTLSSYSIVLMVIHYLQYGCHPPVLPCLQNLQPDKYHPNSDVRELNIQEDLPDFKSANEQSLGSLFLGFLEYFSREFNFQENAISIRLGGTLPKAIAMNSHSPKNKKGHWKFLCIEEPFDLTNTASSVFDFHAFSYVKQVFQKSWQCLRKTSNLYSILS